MKKKEITMTFSEDLFEALYRTASYLLSRDVLDMLHKYHHRTGNGTLVVDESDFIQYRKLQMAILTQLHYGDKKKIIEMRDFYDQLLSDMEKQEHYRKLNNIMNKKEK